MGVDEGIHPQADHHKDRAQQIDGHIGVGVGVGGAAGPKQVEHWFLNQQEESRDCYAEDEQQGQGIAHDLLSLLPVPPAPVHGAQRRPAGAAQVGKAHDDGNDR